MFIYNTYQIQLTKQLLLFSYGAEIGMEPNSAEWNWYANVQMWHLSPTYSWDKNTPTKKNRPIDCY